MKWLGRIGIALVLVVVLIFAGIIFYGGAIIRQGVETVGPKVIGVPVTLNNAHLFPLRGKAGLSGLTIDNPEGFNTRHLIKLDGIQVELDMASLQTDTVVIKSIEIREPDIFYEMSLKGSNFKALLKGMEGEPKEEGEEAEPDTDKPAGDEEAGKKVVIESLKILDGTVRISSKMLHGLNAPIPLPDIELKDIGKEKGGTSPTEVIQMVLGEVAGAVTSVAKGVLDVAGKGVKAVGKGAVAVGEGAVDGVKAVGKGAVAVGEGAVDGVTAVGKGAAVVGEGAVDGVKAVGKGAAVVGEGAVDGVKAVGKGAAVVGEGAAGGVKAVGTGAAKGLKAVGSGAGSLVKGVGGLLGGEEEEVKAPAEE